MNKMNWKQWKLGVLISLILSLLVSGSGLSAGMHWQAFVAVFCTSALTHLGAFLTQHPVDTISFDTTHIVNTQVTETTVKTPSVVPLTPTPPAATVPVETQPKAP